MRINYFLMALLICVFGLACCGYWIQHSFKNIRDELIDESQQWAQLYELIYRVQDFNEKAERSAYLYKKTADFKYINSYQMARNHLDQVLIPMTIEYMKLLEIDNDAQIIKIVDLIRAQRVLEQPMIKGDSSERQLFYLYHIKDNLKEYSVLRKELRNELLKIILDLSLKYSDRLNEYKKNSDYIQTTFIIQWSMVVLFIVVTAWFIRRSLVIPMMRLYKHSNRFAQDQSYIIKPISSPLYEVQCLSDSISELTTTVRDQISDLRKQAQISNELKEKFRSESMNKTQFVANISHEIRTPLNSIVGVLKILHDECASHHQYYISRADNSARLLLSLVNDVLDFSKLNQNEISSNKTTFSFCKLLRQVIDSTKHYAESKPVEICITQSRNSIKFDRMTGDKRSLEQILTNLLSNALKFTDYGEVKIVSELENDGEKGILKISVTDTGIGMTEDEISLAFEPFKQVDYSTTRSIGGTGLGLAIVKGLIENLGGKLSCSSEKNISTKFVFEIPVELDLKEQRGTFESTPQVKWFKSNIDDYFYSSLVADFIGVSIIDGRATECKDVVSASETEHSVICNCSNYETVKGTMGNSRLIVRLDKNDSPPEGSFSVLPYPFIPAELVSIVWKSSSKDENQQTQRAHRYEPLRILLVDDIDLNLEIAAHMMRRSGLIVTTANSGGKAIDLVNKYEFDAVLMDLHMPVMDGFETTKRIRASHALNTLPILALTADARSEFIDNYEHFGFSEYILKPFDVDELIQVIISLSA